MTAEHGISQEGVLRRLSDDICELPLRLKVSLFKTRYKAGSTILAAALDFGVVKTANRILKMSFSVNQPTATPFGYTLHITLSGSWGPTGNFRISTRREMVDILFWNGADVSLKSQFGQTVSHTGAIQSPDVVLAVLDKKPNVGRGDAAPPSDL